MSDPLAHRQKPLRVTTAGLILLGAIALCSGRPAPEDVRAASRVSGEDFFEKHCATCHGRDGRGDTLLGRRQHVPDLTSPGVQAQVSDAGIRNHLLRGVPGEMPGYAGRVDEAEVAAITREVRRLGGERREPPRVPSPPPIVEKPTPHQLATEAFQRRCATCHGADGRASTPFAREIRAADLTSPWLQARLDDDALRGASIGGAPHMPGQGDALSAEELQGLVEVIRSMRRSGPIVPEQRLPDPPALPDEDPAQEYFENHCAICHGLEGQPASRLPALLLPKIDLASPGALSRYSDAELTALIAEGRPHEMSAYRERLSADAIQKLATYARTLSDPGKVAERRARRAQRTTLKGTVEATAHPPTAAIQASALRLTGEEFFERRCSTCHGRDGHADTLLGRRHHVPDLTHPDIQRHFSDADIRAHVLNGLPGTMPAYEGRLAEAELADIIAVVRRLAGIQVPRPKPLAEKPAPEPPPSIAELGREVYGETCSTCHGPDGRAQTSFAREVHAADLSSPRLQDRLTDGALAAVAFGGHLRIQRVERNLDPMQLVAVTSYVRSLRRAGPAEPEVTPAPPEPPKTEAPIDPASDYFEKHCATCHGVDGKGVTRMGKLLAVQDLSDPRVQARFTDDQCAASIWNGAPHEMAAYSERMHPSLVSDLVRHVRSLAKDRRAKTPSLP